MTSFDVIPAAFTSLVPFEEWLYLILQGLGANMVL